MWATTVFLDLTLALRAHVNIRIFCHPLAVFVFHILFTCFGSMCKLLTTHASFTLAFFANYVVLFFCINVQNILAIRRSTEHQFLILRNFLIDLKSLILFKAAGVDHAFDFFYLWFISAPILRTLQLAMLHLVLNQTSKRLSKAFLAKFVSAFFQKSDF